MWYNSPLSVVSAILGLNGNINVDVVILPNELLSMKH
jgi:hypothetical protein